jgi:hypothetical protein
MVSATSSFTDPSCEESDPHHHHHHSSASTSSSTSASSMTPVFDTGDIHIQVSGASFILNPTVFRQLEKLPWSINVNNSNNDENHVVYSLGASPDLFEIMLNYVLFESLPNVKLLSQSDIEELEPMVLITGLQGLQNHLEKKDLKSNFLRNRSFCRNATAAVPDHQLRQQSDRPMSTNDMNNGNDNNKLLRRQVSAPVLGVSSTHETLNGNNSNNSNSNNNKGMAGRLVQAVARRLNSQQQQQSQKVRKLTHAQLVASDLVD